ncbi:hypothetical protein FZI85_29815 [Mycobacterium sp. CBMA293]|uniref:hypothetical protein n=1 Tax=unclassified Mycolicibacterium TaxID=2636767 RepID=UPI0012DEAF1E|nr:MULTISPECIES: hypothetical protein [unclassified Mycolicibacterium]MUL49891.1 hypothetical protein [Mycolicibacterium sp. CBMA 360]MUL62710.1 hypothetical protein [Mycolicibacterium sp. CBMA 335]MUL70742.1 hypothetical protein [Mycolicibacterium sp. CBMA 311]MUL97234.1 hypothetical protein [Mycolicibacterium sp. CBMA 230]MUM15191.1 hypothetical protein [Mycolicibacterium sp. CBMA 293]
MARWLGPRALDELLPDAALQTVLRADLSTQRAALVTVKTGLGHAGICAMLRREMALAERTAQLAVAVSRRRTTYSVTRLTASNCSANEFAFWLNNLTTENVEADMVSACPDHYLLRGLANGHEALLTVEFPVVFPRHLVAAHRWHLAAEFSNWIVA